jgi:hypothetical protein
VDLTFGGLLVEKKYTHSDLFQNLRWIRIQKKLKHYINSDQHVDENVYMLMHKKDVSIYSYFAYLLAVSTFSKKLGALYFVIYFKRDSGQYVFKAS